MKKTVDGVLKKIRERGNDAEIRATKDGIKVYEVKRKLVAVFSEGEQEGDNENPCH